MRLSIRAELYFSLLSYDFLSIIFTLMLSFSIFSIPIAFLLLLITFLILKFNLLLITNSSMEYTFDPRPENSKLISFIVIY